jgi:TonB-dependent SusC/RagA subfamily outer membrane receptor
MDRDQRQLAFWRLPAALMFILGVVVAPAAAQQGTVAGRVQDSSTGLALPAAQVYLSALDIGVLTQANGRYVLLNVPPGNHTITAERIGYQTVSQQVTVSAGGTAVADFNLAEQALQLNELIITGTPGGTQRRALGNVVSRLDAAAVTESAPIVNVEQLVSTRVPGLATISAGGFVGSGAADLRIRGSSSVGLANDPLIYIDGVRVTTERTESRRIATSRLNDINPEDIESIEVIKGPAASTLYGTEASNGVIQIITKRGTTGAPRFDASVELGANYMADPAGKMFTNYATSATGELLQMNMAEAYEARNGKSLFQNGLIQKYSISAQGGTDVVRYFASYNRSDQEGPVSWNHDLTQTGRLNLDLTVNEQVSFGLNASIMSGFTRTEGDFWVQTMRGSPLGAADYGGVDTPLQGWGSLTPEALRDYNEWAYETQRKNFVATGRFTPWPWLQTRVVGGVDHTDQVDLYTVFREPDAPNGIWGNNGLGTRDVDDRVTQLSTLDASATASYDLTAQLGTATSVGFQYYKRQVWNTSLSGDEFATEALSTVGAAARTSASENEFTNVTVGSYVQEQFDWEDRIFLTGAVRFDQNSAFGADYGVQIYPKVSAAWVVSDESFWNFDFMNQLRLRGAWGAAGRLRGATAVPAHDGAGQPAHPHAQLLR